LRRVLAPSGELGLRSPIYLIFGGRSGIKRNWNLESQATQGKTTWLIKEIYFAGGFRCTVYQEYHISLTRKHENYRETSSKNVMDTKP